MLINWRNVFTMIAVALAALVIIIGGLFGVVASIKSFNRAQKVKDAKNSVKVTTIYIQRQRQEAKRIAARDGVVQAQADQRIIEARGIAKSQELISGSLTPLYVQHEAIQNQRRSGGERVYIPVGPQGVPLVADVSGGKQAVK